MKTLLNMIFLLIFERFSIFGQQRKASVVIFINHYSFLNGYSADGITSGRATREDKEEKKNRN